MTIFRTVELISGIATSLLTLSYFFLLMPTQAEAEFRGPFSLGWFFAYGVPGALTVTGAYFHSVKHRSWGSVVLGITTVLCVIFILLNFFGGVIGYMGVSAFLWGIAPAIMSIFTGFVAFAVVRFEKSK
jgi:ABC-type enterobactin transport system permease subunit